MDAIIMTPGSAPPTPVVGVAPANGNNFGRDKMHWTLDIWGRIDKAVHDEVMRTRSGQQFLPTKLVPQKTMSVPTDAITTPTRAAPTLTVDEGSTTRLNEYYVEFLMTEAQAHHEGTNTMELGHSTAVTLATRAANILSQAEDLIIFSGQNAISGSTLFQSGIVLNRGVPADTGLLGLPPGTPPLPESQIIRVQPKDPAVPGVYAENTFAAVAQAYSVLQGNGHNGPFAAILDFRVFADTYAPLPGTLILTADRIKPLMTAGFFGTGTLPSNPPGTEPRFYGLVVSLGGNTMNLVVGLDATTAFMQQDTDGAFRFRVFDRFAFTLNEETARERLEFL
jgi:uncharacterized linocin/CFP29 family protein